MRDLDPTSPAPALDLTIPYKSKEELEANYKTVFMRDLFPYEDGKFLVGRIASPNRILRHAPELYDQTRAALVADDDESLIGLAEDIDIARQLYAPENAKPISAILSFVTLLEAIRQQLPSVDGAGARINALINLIIKRTADSFPEDQLLDATQTIHYICNQLQQLYNETGYTQLETINLELFSLLDAIYVRLHTYQYIDMLPADLDNITTEEMRHDTQHVAELFTEIRATQHYGVKMGYVEDPRGGTLIFSPPIDPSEVFAHVASPHPLMLQDSSIAGIRHSRKKRHSRIKIKATQLTQGLSSIGNVDDIDPITSMSLGKDGELYTDRDCRTPLVDIARAKGKYTAYRDMQARIIAHYFDITHSLDEVRQVQQTITATNAETHTSSRSPMESIERLVIPRANVRKGEQIQTIHNIQENRPSRNVRQHGVVWHIRELPEGWHASPNALELAKKLGVTLRPNETIVKEHRRGSRLLGEVTAHHLIQRSLQKDNL